MTQNTRQAQATLKINVFMDNKPIQPKENFKKPQNI